MTQTLDFRASVREIARPLLTEVSATPWTWGDVDEQLRTVGAFLIQQSPEIMDICDRMRLGVELLAQAEAAGDAELAATRRQRLAELRCQMDALDVNVSMVKLAKAAAYVRELFGESASVAIHAVPGDGERECAVVVKGRS